MAAAISRPITASPPLCPPISGQPGPRPPNPTFPNFSSHSTGHATGVPQPSPPLTPCIFPPPLTYGNPAPACDLGYGPNQARRMDVRIAISNGFGFGGHNAVVVLKKFEE